MKIKFILTMLVLVLTASFSYASFPVERTVTTTSATAVTKEVKKQAVVSPAAAKGEKSQGVAFLFWFILGWPFAAHRWYLGSPWYWNVLFIITIGGLGIWAIVDVIGILTGSYEPHDGSYKDSFF